MFKLEQISQFILVNVNVDFSEIFAREMPFVIYLLFAAKDLLM